MKILFFLLCLNHLIFAFTDIHIYVDKDSIFVGDKVEVSITVTTTEVLNIEFPKLDVDNKDITLSTITLGDTSLILYLQFWQPGYHQFPSVEIKTLKNDSILTILSTDPVDFNILDRIETLEHGLRQSKINKNIQIPFTINKLILILIILLSITVLYIIIGKKKKMNLPKESFRKIDFFNDAMGELDKLILPEKFETKELEIFYTSVCDIIKGYLVTKFFFNATKMTTDEIVGHLKMNDIPMDGLNDFLQEADLCRFAQKKYGVTALLEVKKTAKSLLVNFESISI